MPAQDPDGIAAASIAFEAGQLLLSMREMYLSSGTSNGVLSPDARSNELITRRLSERYPHDAILSEESADGPGRLERERVWIIDPLDGSREFGEASRDDWAVHVALIQAKALTAGAVSLPAAGDAVLDRSAVSSSFQYRRRIASGGEQESSSRGGKSTQRSARRQPCADGLCGGEDDWLLSVVMSMPTCTQVGNSSGTLPLQSQSP